VGQCKQNTLDNFLFAFLNLLGISVDNSGLFFLKLWREMMDFDRAFDDSIYLLLINYNILVIDWQNTGHSYFDHESMVLELMICLRPKICCSTRLVLPARQILTSLLRYKLPISSLIRKFILLFTSGYFSIFLFEI
jgi:hypothetical protein